MVNAARVAGGRLYSNKSAMFLACEVAMLDAPLLQVLLGCSADLMEFYQLVFRVVPRGGRLRPWNTDSGHVKPFRWMLLRLIPTDAPRPMVRPLLAGQVTRSIIRSGERDPSGQSDKTRAARFIRPEQGTQGNGNLG